MKFAPSQQPEHFEVLFQNKDGINTLRDDKDILIRLQNLTGLADIDFNFHDADFNTPLYLAVANNKTETLNFLIQKGASLTLAIADAFHLGNKAALQQLLDRGAEVNDVLYRKANTLLNLKAREMSPQSWFMDKANFKKDQQTECAELIMRVYEKQQPKNTFKNKMYIGHA